VKAGEMLEVLTPAGKVYPLRLEQMQDDAGVAIAVAPHAQMHFSIAAALPLPQYSLLRRKI
jgi:putative protease